MTIRYISRAVTLLSGCLLAATAAYSQSTTSPVSMFGIGEVDQGNYGINSGMAGLGIGFREVSVLNSVNPASLTSLNPKTFLLDGSVFGKYTYAQGRGKTSKTLMGNLQRFSFGFTPAKTWGTSFGILPYSTVGYNISSEKDVEGSPGETFTTTFDGSGGLTKIYMGNAVNLFPQLSLGVNSSYIFGTIYHNERTDVFSISRQMRTGKLYFDFGLQYTGKLSDDWQFSAGAVYGYQQKIKMETKEIAAGIPSGSVLQNDTKPSRVFYLPEFYGGGLNFIHKNHFTVGLDYSFHKWSVMKVAQVDYVDVHTARLGLSYIPNVYNPRRYSEVIKYQFGVTVNNSALEIKDKNPLNFAVSAGAVLPLKSNADINVSLQYGQNGGNYFNNKSIRENFVKMTVGFTFRETWFMRYLFQ